MSDQLMAKIMACCSSEDQKNREEALKRSQAIDRMLEEHSKELKNECRMLMLGPGESGKATILKQMKILYQGGYSQEERISYSPTIFKDLIDSVKAIFEAMKQYKIGLHRTENIKHVHYLEKHPDNFHPSSTLDPQVGVAVTAIWNDPCISEVLGHSSELFLRDSAPYFFEEVNRIASPDYVPTEADILRARTRTCGFHETSFKMGEIEIRMFELGGARGERKKWIHMLDDMTAILFTVNINEYDQALFEDSDQTRLNEALVLFDSVINSRWFSKATIFLFFNKIDLFREKLEKVPFSKHFPDYTGDDDVHSAWQYLCEKFCALDRTGERAIYPQ